MRAFGGMTADPLLEASGGGFCQVVRILRKNTASMTTSFYYENSEFSTIFLIALLFLFFILFKLVI